MRSWKKTAPGNLSWWHWMTIGRCNFWILLEYIQNKSDPVISNDWKNPQASRVDDGHVEALGNSMVQEDAVHGISQGVETTEREGQVAQAAREGNARASALDFFNCIDEVKSIGVVLWQASGNGQHVAVEDDVLWREIQVLPEDPVAALADPDLVFKSCSLALLVERHDNDGRTVTHAQVGMLDELLLTWLERDGVDNAFALHALQAFLHNMPLWRVNHERQLGHSGLSDAKLHELAHCRLTIDEVGIEVEVQNVGLLLALSNANLHCLIPLVSIYQLLELGGAHEVAAFSNPLEACLFVHTAWLETREHHGGVLGQFRQLADRALLDLLAHSCDVGWESAAASTHKVEQAILGVVQDVGGENLRISSS